jgi:hypothetical protein
VANANQSLANAIGGTSIEVARRLLSSNNRPPCIPFSAMDAGVARCAQRNQVLFGVVAGAAAKLFVMDL